MRNSLHFSAHLQLIVGSVILTLFRLTQISTEFYLEKCMQNSKGEKVVRSLEFTNE